MNDEERHIHMLEGSLADAERELSILRQLVRVAWEQGFMLCRSYGDNHVHFAGAQRERQWIAFVAEHVTPVIARSL